MAVFAVRPSLAPLSKHGDNFQQEFSWTLLNCSRLMLNANPPCVLARKNGRANYARRQADAKSTGVHIKAADIEALLFGVDSVWTAFEMNCIHFNEIMCV